MGASAKAKSRGRGTERVGAPGTPKETRSNEGASIFTTPGAARYLGVGESTLRLWRENHEGPKYFRAGDRLIRYRKVDLDSYIESRLS